MQGSFFGVSAWKTGWPAFGRHGRRSIIGPCKPTIHVFHRHGRQLADGWFPRLLAAHLAAIFIAPWSSPPPAPLLAERAARLIAPYLTAAYLNHGYRFFAPDPGPSHLVRYELRRTDGTVVEGRIPDPQRDWPRLLYHRHFMITESLFNTLSRVEDVPIDSDVSPADRVQIEDQNRYARSLAQYMTQGIAQQLLKQFDGQSVKLYLQEHAIPFPQDVQRGKRLDAPDLYSDLAELGEFRGNQP